MNTCTRKIDEESSLPFGPSTTVAPVLEVSAHYNGMLLGTRFLADAVPAWYRRRARGFDTSVRYVIGQSAKADAPAPAELLDGADMPLVTKWGQDFLINVTPQMTGKVAVGKQVFPLKECVAGRGNNFTLPVDARASIRCGAMTFRLARTDAAPALPKRWLRWRWSEQRFTVGSFLALGLFLLMIVAIPPEGMAVSSDFAKLDTTFVLSTVAPPEEPVPEVLKQPSSDPGEAGEAGKAHAGESGKAGRPDSKRTNGVFKIKGNGIDMHTGKAEAVAQIRNMGFLGVLNSAKDGRFASIFGRGTAVGDGAETFEGGLTGVLFR